VRAIRIAFDRGIAGALRHAAIAPAAVPHYIYRTQQTEISNVMKRQELSDALKEAMKARDARATSTLRMALAKIKDKDIEARLSDNHEGIDDAAVLALLQGMVKQRRESIVLYQQGNRQDLVDQESAEIALIERFLPAQLDADAARTAIQALIQEIGAAGIKDMGRTMAALKERFAGQMDFTKASALVKEALTGAG
jgi:uncharacterized protein YqeY